MEPNEVRQLSGLDREGGVKRNGEQARPEGQTPPAEASHARGPTDRGLLDLQERLAVFEQVMAELLDLQKASQATIEQREIEQQVFANIHDECQALRERHYEREILEPLMRGLILIADRVRQENDKLRRTLRTYNGALASALVFQHVIDARKDDLVEIEALLAQYGVERFRNTDDAFDRSTQTCVQRVQTPDLQLIGQVAQRLLPGYRRGEAVLLRERVNVYVAHNRS